MQNYVVIGGSSGIGESLVRLLSQKQNATIFASYHSSFKENTQNVHYFKFNVLEDDLNLDDFPEKIDGLAYCPGSIHLKPFSSFSEQSYLDDFRLNVTGATKVIQHLLPKLRLNEPSSVVLFSTVAVQKGFPYHAQVATSKGAVEGLTRALAAEFAPKIRVNAIAPSLTDTPMAGKLLNTPEKLEKQSQFNPMKRVGKPTDIAKMAAFLLSEDSSWITGQIMHVDGGFSVVHK